MITESVALELTNFKHFAHLNIQWIRWYFIRNPRYAIENQSPVKLEPNSRYKIAYQQLTNDCSTRSRIKTNQSKVETINWSVDRLSGKLSVISRHFTYEIFSELDWTLINILLWFLVLSKQSWKIQNVLNLLDSIPTAAIHIPMESMLKPSTGTLLKNLST